MLFRSSCFKGDKYEIDTKRPFGGYEADDLICYVQPFFGVPITLNIAIRTNGEIIFRSWEWNGKGNGYLHTSENPENFTATQEQIDTINGLFSRRILFEGLEIAVGASVQKICPIDVKREEKLKGEKIYLA